ncbi:MAG TPA: site-specific integrase [Candidatus Avelusimicrobium excrementipullorum]|nr:site-specific integrase [Candidatus Avelusimicrobium excrementipullorum]
MRIYTDPRTGMKYADYVLQGKRRRKSLHTKNNQVAIMRAATLDTDKTIQETTKMPFSVFLAKYRAYIAANLAPNSISSFEYAVEKLQSTLSIRYVQDITPRALEQLKLTLKSQDYKPVSINSYLTLLKGMLYYAERENILPPLPWKSVKKLRAPKGRVEFHSPQEIAAILALHTSISWKLVVLLGVRAGLRAAEINSLKWQDVDLSRRQIYIAPSKTERFRLVPISQDLYNMLQSVKVRQADEYVIGDWHYNTVRSLCSTYRSTTKKLGLHCHLHKLRHTFASHLAQAGVDLYRISKLLGHSSIQMTEIYAHLSPSDMPGAIEKLPEIK